LITNLIIKSNFSSFISSLEDYVKKGIIDGSEIVLSLEIKLFDVRE
jgi:hypothetical protein